MSLPPSNLARVQLLADFINNIAGNLIAVGTLGPLVGYVFLSSDTRPSLWLLIGIALICFGMAIILYLWASSALKVLDDE